jgi:hypothetical protein
MKGVRNWPLSLVNFLGTFLIIREKPSWEAASSNYGDQETIVYYRLPKTTESLM